MLAHGLGDVDRDQLRLGAERAAEAEPEVHRHADHERDVGVRERRPARAGEEQLVVGGHHAAGQAVEEDRDPQLLDERAQRGLAMPPVEVRARHHDGPLGAA